jgi:hypothetical protein
MKKHFAAIFLAWALLVRHFFRPRTHSTEPNGDVGGVFEFYTRGGGILRSDVADAIVIRTTNGACFRLLPDIEAGGFATHNLEVSVGVGIRFPK